MKLAQAKKSRKLLFHFNLDFLATRGGRIQKAQGLYWAFYLSQLFPMYIRFDKSGFGTRIFIDGKLTELKNLLSDISGVIPPTRGMTTNSKFHEFLIKQNLDTGKIAHEGWRFQFETEEACIKFLEICESYAAHGIDNSIEKAKGFDRVHIKTSKQTTIESRVGQNKFRKNLLEYWGACAITGVKLHSLLRASHIKPWADATPRERLDPFNGILLIPTIDALFDDGLISFGQQGEILISSLIPADVYGILGLSLDFKMRKLNGAHKSYLAYHHQKIFKA